MNDSRFFPFRCAGPCAVLVALAGVCLSAHSATAELALTGKPWVDMNYGPFHTDTYEVAPGELVNKGIAVRLDEGEGGASFGREFMVFDTDALRFGAGWVGELMNYFNINMDGRHVVHASIVGRKLFLNLDGPGWGHPESGSFEDDRIRGLDGRPYGPLNREWAKWKGHYVHGDQIVFSYRVGSTDVLEMASSEANDDRLILTRTLNLGPRKHDLVMQVAHQSDGTIELRDAAAGKFAVLLSNVDEDVIQEYLPKTEAELEAAREERRRQRRERRRARRLERLQERAADEDDDDDEDEEDEEEYEFPELRPTTPPGVGYAVTVIGLQSSPEGVEWITTDDGNLRLRISAGEQPLRLKVAYSHADNDSAAAAVMSEINGLAQAADLEPLCQGGPRRWNEEVDTERSVVGNEDGPYVVEAIQPPLANPYRCWMRLGGFDFFSDASKAAVCTWQGDVWIVDGLGGDSQTHTWRRIASGMFQPLGVKIIDDVIYLTCRDQLTILRDLNGDGETDFYENFNNDVQVTEHFHEFAMDLETDDEGNFYYCKAARHARGPLVPHHGTLLRVSKDGSRTDIIARGFRAPNGVCLNGDGTFYVSDQQGHWCPANRINLVRPDGFYGNMFTINGGREPDSAEQPVFWLHPRFDRSPAQQLWNTSDQWGPLKGRLLNLSYGIGRVSLIMIEEVNGTRQGGMVYMPIQDMPTGIMRGRYHPDDGQLYVCGLFGWSGDKTAPGGFYRIRYTGKPLNMPVEIQAQRDGMLIRFSDPLDRESAAKRGSYSVSRWNYRRTAEYGSEDYRVSNPRRQGRDRVRVEDVTVSDDGHKVLLHIGDMQPSMQMEIRYRLKAADGTTMSQTIQNTIHVVGGANELANN